ncbi:MAG: hypothetical protein HRU13_10560, partial [Phycisphaerales bacterium]|nr:hypothetical protein [Phycisphaerales bacterium]
MENGGAQAGGSVDDTRLQELVKTLVEDPKNAVAEREFWHEFCRLRDWNFVASAEDAQKAIEAGQPGVPLQIFRDGDRTLVPVYTSAALTTGVLGDKPVAAITMPPEEALAYACAMRGRIDGIMVNVIPGKASGFGFRLPDLCAFFHNEMGYLPAAAIRS